MVHSVRREEAKFLCLNFSCLVIKYEFYFTVSMLSPAVYGVLLWQPKTNTEETAVGIDL